MNTYLRGIFLLVALFVATAGVCNIAQAAELIVGVAQQPPFAIKNEDGTWTGLAIELWQQVAGELGVESRYQEHSFQDLLAALEKGEVDVAPGALTITAEREQVFDFTHAYYPAGLGIASRRSGSIGVGHLLSRLFSLRFLRALAALAGVLFVIGGLVWIFERRRNADQFGGSNSSGLGNGFWWAAVTMTTVGYGDKAPVTLGGRIVALVWMFASIILISGFIGALASAFTIEELGSQIRGSADLPRVRVGTLQTSAAAQYLTEKHIGFESLASNEEGLQALADGRLDAFVGDQPILQYWVNAQHRNTLTVLPQTLDQGYLAFGVPSDSRLLKELDVALLSAIQSPGWADLVHEYLGVSVD